MSGNSDPRLAAANTGTEASSKPKWDRPKAVVTPKTRWVGAIMIFKIDGWLVFIYYNYMQQYYKQI
jgi:hypothetical protein